MNILIKLRKGIKEVKWEDKVPHNCSSLEIISPSIEELPERFHELKDLKKLTLVTPELKRLPESLYLLEDLELLKIKNSQNIVINQLANFKNLKTIQLANLKLKELPIWVCENLKLDTLDIHGNELISLAKGFENLKNLKRVNLDNNNFSALPWELEQLPSLNHLSLENNNFPQEEKNRITRIFNYNF